MNYRTSPPPSTPATQRRPVLRDVTPPRDGDAEVAFPPGHARERQATRGDAPPERRLPLLLKVAYTLFMAVLVPVYWTKYGPTNFLYFCDVALFLTLAGLWRESPLLLSMAAVGILVPQALWCLDFAVHLGGFQLTGMTDYMFDSGRSLFLRGLSLFHGWLPFLLLFAVVRLGYDRRGLAAWTILAWGLCAFCFVAMPPAGPEFAGKLVPNNINYVWGFDDAKPQAWLPAPAYLVTWMASLLGLAYYPTHLLLRRWSVR